MGRGASLCGTLHSAFRGDFDIGRLQIAVSDPFLMSRFDHIVIWRA
jgi:hypothetical protein